MRVLFLADAFREAEGYGSVCRALRSLGHTVDYKPLSMMAIDAGRQASQGISPMPPDGVLHQKGVTLLQPQFRGMAKDCDVVLIWKGGMIHPKAIEQMAEQTKVIFYTWDDPYEFEVNPLHVQRAVAAHFVATCDEGSLSKYAVAGVENAMWLVPGYDPETHYEDGAPEVDVCFVATNTYCKELYGKVETPPFDRRDLVKAALEVTKSVELWGGGDSPCGWIHPTHGDPTLAPYYKRFIPYEEARKAYSRARVCINTHVRRTGYKYLNERTFQILGCKRPMLIDFNPGTQEVLGEGACYFESIVSFQKTLAMMLGMRKLAEETAERGYQLAQEHTWVKFCQTLLEAANA